MRYNQFDHLEKFEGDFYRKITEIVAVHLHVDGDSAAFLGEALISRGFSNRYQVFDLSKDITALERISAALREISRAMSDASLSPLASERLNQSLLFGSFFDKFLASDNSFDMDNFREYIEKTGRQDLEALARIESDVLRIRSGVDRTINHIKRSPLAKKSASKFNSDAVGVVSACRYVWEMGIFPS